MSQLVVRNLVKHFPIHSGIFQKTTGKVHAVSGVSLTIAPGETLGLVGESGCGKSTLARLIVRLLTPDAGTIMFDGRIITHDSQRSLQSLRRDLQMIFQDPFASLNPRMTVGAILAEPFRIHRVGTRRDRPGRVAALLDLVGLAAEAMHRYPHEFSGGERQRIGIARAIALRPKLVIADEPVSALDVSVQGEILNLLLDLQEQLGLAYLLIAHDIKVVAQISHRIAVMYLGRIVETLPAAELLRACHPYTHALLASVPEPNPAQARAISPIGGDVPSPIAPPRGCPFHPRCPRRQLPLCAETMPAMTAHAGDRHAACHFPVDSHTAHDERSPSLPHARS
ncbi:MAG: ATP-binding cassette domain-containing protein [Deltaproteobacteria bacterium]|nr:ATP-binding cassette domain-containing protein [Deltaproteobacteria bacterium]